MKCSASTGEMAPRAVWLLELVRDGDRGGAATERLKIHFVLFMKLSSMLFLGLASFLVILEGSCSLSLGYAPNDFSIVQVR